VAIFLPFALEPSIVYADTAKQLMESPPISRRGQTRADRIPVLVDERIDPEA
jgi:hypothetical protein